MLMQRIFCGIVAGLLGAGQMAQAAPYKGPFTGLFYGQGRGCWGGLFIGTRTITWDKQFTPCARTTYTILDRDLHWPFQDDDHIVVWLNHVSAACISPIIGLYYYQPAWEINQPEGLYGLYSDWTAVGFQTEKLYRDFPYRAFDDGSVQVDPYRYIVCGLPYSEKPFPFGIPTNGP